MSSETLDIPFPQYLVERVELRLLRLLLLLPLRRLLRSKKNYEGCTVYNFMESILLTKFEGRFEYFFRDKYKGNSLPL